MSTDHVKLGHLFAEIVSGHDLSRFDEILAAGYVNHNPFAEPGPEGVKKVFGAIIADVPNLKVFAEDVFGSADGTRVVGRYHYVGTHTGSFLGYPATGNAFAMRSIDIWRVEDGALRRALGRAQYTRHLQPGRCRAATWPAVVTQPIQRPTRHEVSVHACRQSFVVRLPIALVILMIGAGAVKLRRSWIGPRLLRALGLSGRFSSGDRRA